LEKSQKKLQTLIPEFDCLIDVNTDVLDFSESMESIISAIRSTEKQIDNLGRSLNRGEKDAAVATEMTVKIMRILQDYHTCFYQLFGFPDGKLLHIVFHIRQCAFGYFQLPSMCKVF